MLLTVSKFLHDSSRLLERRVKANSDVDDDMSLRRRFCGHFLSRPEWVLNHCLNSRILTALLLTYVCWGRSIVKASDVDVDDI